MKKKQFTIVLALILCVVGVLILTSTKAAASTFEEKIKESQERKAELEQLLEDAKNRKEEYEQHKQETQDKMASLQTDIDSILTYIEQIDMELATVTENLDSLEIMIAEREEKLLQVQLELEEAILAEEEQYETMKNRIRYIYENGNESIWDVLVSADGLIDFLNRMEYRSKIAAYDNTLLERYELAKEITKTNEAYVEASLEELYQLKEEAEFERDSYLALSAEKGEQIELYMAQYQITEEILEEYGEQIENEEMTIEEIYRQEEERAQEEAQIRAEEEERIRLEEERKRQEEERRRAEEEERKRKEEEERLRKEAEEKKRLEEQMAQERLNAAANIEMTLETSLKKMIWPLPGDPNVYSKFGPRKAPLPGATTYHQGVDIGGKYGAQIVAALAGTATVSYSATGGNRVVINHGNGIKTRYLHCSKVLVKTGDFVMQGQVIALVGSTGISTGPHLHFGVQINNTYVDPLNYISYK